MPAFCAAFGSFHPKSSVTYFVRVFDHGPSLALILELHLDPLLRLDGVDLRRPLVHRPEVLIDADVRLGAAIDSFGAYWRHNGVRRGTSRTRRRQPHGWR